MPLLDRMTGLPAIDDFHQEVETLLGSGQKFSVGLIDMDGIKARNDRVGHDATDTIIKELVTVIKTAFDEKGKLFRRTSGDKFLSIFPDMSEEQAVPPSIFPALIGRVSLLRHLS